MVEALILGRLYNNTLGVAKKQKTTIRGKTYYRYTLSLPREVLERLLDGKNEVPVLVYIARASHLNLLVWDEEDILWTRLPEEAKTELYYQGRAPTKPAGRVVFIAAEEEEVRRLGLDPEKPVTLKDVIRAVEKRIAVAQPPTG